MTTTQKISALKKAWALKAKLEKQFEETEYLAAQLEKEIVKTIEVKKISGAYLLTRHDGLAVWISRTCRYPQVKWYRNGKKTNIVAKDLNMEGFNWCSRVALELAMYKSKKSSK